MNIQILVLILTFQFWYIVFAFSRSVCEKSSQAVLEFYYNN